jgi:lysine 2,3-aminomutase
MSKVHPGLPADIASLPRTLRSLSDLVAAGLVAEAAVPALVPVAQRYAVAVTPAVAELVDRADPADPVARQFVPHADELRTLPVERADPIGDEAHSPVPGIVHRYPDRVLLKAVSVCPVYCRFCFRRETVGPGGPGTLSSEALSEALAYVAAHPAVWEVIVTGGDPLMLGPRRIGELMDALAAIPHVRVVRWHTRVPVVDPGRVTAELAGALRRDGVASYVAIHANHPREFSPAARAALARLADAGVVLVSQSVLLRGVNDDPAVLADLMRAFVENRVMPYLIHHPDLAPGTERFRMTLSEGRALVETLRGHVSGLCQPTYVLDIPGGFGKVPVDADHVEPVPGTDGGRWRVRDFQGQVHLYPPEPLAITESHIRQSEKP